MRISTGLARLAPVGITTGQLPARAKWKILSLAFGSKSVVAPLGQAQRKRKAV